MLQTFKPFLLISDNAFRNISALAFELQTYKELSLMTVEC